LSPSLPALSRPGGLPCGRLTRERGWARGSLRRSSPTVSTVA
jgi:hypothetical protein